MATTASAHGLRPVRLLSGQPYTGATRLYKIASGYATNLFNGDIVKGLTDGTVAKDTGTTSATPIGVFQGVTYTDPNLGYKVHRQYWPASTVAADAYAYVADDPDLVFEIQSDEAVALTGVNANFAIVQGAGVTATGNSGVLLDGSTVATTNTLPLRLIGFPNGRPGSVIGDTYTDCLVIWNAGMHMYRNATGV